MHTSLFWGGIVWSRVSWVRLSSNSFCSLSLRSSYLCFWGSGSPSEYHLAWIYTWQMDVLLGEVGKWKVKSVRRKVYVTLGASGQIKQQNLESSLVVMMGGCRRMEGVMWSVPGVKITRILIHSTAQPTHWTYPYPPQASSNKVEKPWGVSCELKTEQVVTKYWDNGRMRWCQSLLGNQGNLTWPISIQD